jgi:hypothetical protein
MEFINDFIYRIVFIFKVLSFQYLLKPHKNKFEIHHCTSFIFISFKSIVKTEEQVS